jgi:predicted MFS family arabinose efflux permease
VLYSLLFSFIPAGIAWRVMFMIGILPALLVLYIRRRVPEPPAFRERAAAGVRADPLAIFRPGQLRTTIFAVLLATGVQGGNYAMATWLPTYLSKNRGLNAVGTGGFLVVLILSGVVGSVIAGYLNDWLGRRPTFAIFSLASAIVIFTYVNIPAGANGVLLVLGVPLGFFSSGIFAGFASYLSELYPATSRGAGQGFCYNFGRGVGAFFPAIVGYLSVAVGLGGAIAFAAAGYLLALVSLAFLPETKGRTLEA